MKIESEWGNIRTKIELKIMGCKNENWAKNLAEYKNEN